MQDTALNKGIIRTILPAGASWVSSLSVAGVFYPPQSLPVGNPQPASAVPPSAQHKHGGNCASGGQAELRETI